MVEVEGWWREVQNKKNCGLYFTTNIIRMMKTKRIRWEWHVACMMGKWIQEFCG